MSSSLVQVYFGDGKGKTTAAVGQAVRAAGQGMRVCFVQFMKDVSFPIGERNSLKSLSRNIRVIVHEYPEDLYVDFRVTDLERFAEHVNHFLETVELIARSGQFDLLVLDELGAVLKLGLVSEARVLDLLKSRSSELDVVLTGRNFPQEIPDFADLVTEFKKIKHPFDRGLPARKGIEY
ncbi:MAG TPA: cob(I)yrinic acid a,c-diamide adenosyltransferase [bacterium]|nr:cob(I)yrinic acid a,c-diamide adenosyltransferase [bacterium]